MENKLSNEELAKMAEEVFADNEGDAFWVTEDGCFFQTEVAAKIWAAKIDSEVMALERETVKGLIKENSGSPEKTNTPKGKK